MTATDFQPIREHRIESLDLLVESYRHRSTGAQHLHLASKSAENAFVVAFRTVPEDSRGVAHILEHTVLCGSERFQVRDPFFLMIRRSLNTFMNAMTFDDFTAYPFATQNRKDYFNLMAVYLDAVFFARLNPLDFAQEGHRLEFEELTNADSDLVYRGIVYNEMKGDTSSPRSMLYEAVQAQLYPTSTYHHNSGGNPRVIPDLTYDDLTDFYQSHYHPGNAVFMTFGDISARENQAQIAELVFSRLTDSGSKVSGAVTGQVMSTEAMPAEEMPAEAMPKEIAVVPETRYQAPVISELTYPVDEVDQSGKTHIVLAWLLGLSTDLETMLRAQLLADVLLDTSASPLRRALEQTPLALAVSPLCGLQQEQMEMGLMCGVEGSEPAHAAAIETLILSVLEQVASEGVAREQLEAVLHQLELSQREIGGDSMPYGLQLIFTCLPAAMHRGDPIEQLDLEHALARLRQDIDDPGFFRSLVQDLLLDNPHRVRVTMKPDRHLGAELVAMEKSRLADIKMQMSEAERHQVINVALALQQRQDEEDNPDLLPGLGREDVPVNRTFLDVTPIEPFAEEQATAKQNSPGATINSPGAMIDSPGATGATINSPGATINSPARTDTRRVPVTACGAGTNGIAYFQIVRDLPDLSVGQRNLLPLYSRLLPEVGTGGRDYLQTQQHQHSVSGGVGAYFSVQSLPDDCDTCRALLTLSSRALNRNAAQMVALLGETALEPRFDEHDRIRELVRELTVRVVNGVASGGHRYAMTAAAAGLRRVAALSHHLSGIPGILAMKHLDESLEDQAQVTVLADQLEAIQQMLTTNAPRFLIVSDPACLSDMQTLIADAWSAQGHRSTEQTHLALTDLPQANAPQAFVVTTQVNACASAFATVPESHDDAAALSILGHVLRNNFLHGVLREKGGAYGGGASHDAGSGIFRFYSYRDPNIGSTFDAFRHSVEWVLSATVTDAMLEEAVLGIISNIDAPGSPSGEVKTAYHRALFGRDAAHRAMRRRRVLEVRADDLKRVAAQYLTLSGSRALVTSENRLGEVDAEFEVTRVG